MTREITDPKVSYILDNYLALIRKEFAPAELWVWGSRVYGNPSEYSDVDMILVSPRFVDMGFYERRKLFRRIIGLDRDPNAEVVDILCYTPEEFEKKSNSPTIVREAVEKGIRLD